MTNVEAKEIIEETLKLDPDYMEGEYIEAQEMAIKALEQRYRPTGHWSVYRNADDGTIRKYHCSLCGYEKNFTCYYSRRLCDKRPNSVRKLPKFCENCGAEMSGGE